jgi:hypothetical protein
VNVFRTNRIEAFYEVQIPVRHEIDDRAFLSRSGRSAGSMQVVLDFSGEMVIDNSINIFQVETS